MLAVVLLPFESRAEIPEIDLYDYEEMAIDRPALICFYAEGCNASRSYLNVLERLSGQYAGIVDFYKVDAAEDFDWFRSYDEQAVPLTVAIYDYDDEANRVYDYSQVGYMPYYTAENFIDELIRRWNNMH